MELKDLIPIIESEMSWAHSKYGNYHNAHEQYAVMLEEVEEWWEAVKGNFADFALYELVQVASVALRYVIENGDVEHIAEALRLRHGLKK